MAALPAAQATGRPALRLRSSFSLTRAACPPPSFSPRIFTACRSKLFIFVLSGLDWLSQAPIGQPSANPCSLIGPTRRCNWQSARCTAVAGNRARFKRQALTRSICDINRLYIYMWLFIFCVWIVIGNCARIVSTCVTVFVAGETFLISKNKIKQIIN